MKFSAIIEQASDFLQRKGRISYRTLKLEFDLSEEQLDALKEELIDVQELAVDKDGKMLVWLGAGINGETENRRTGNAEGETAKRGNGETEDGSALQTLRLGSGQASDPGRWTPPHLAERIRAEQVALEARSGTDGERKTITALFADLKGSTALIEGLDPEEARAIIDPALHLMMDAVHQYDGYVAQALGDGIFALFGAPLAHEDHPQRALYAALRMQEEMHRYSDQVRLKHGVPLAMRVGINTGEVVVRSIRKDDLHTDYVPVGHSTNLAARMEQMATPGSILVTAYTQRLTQGYFEFRNLGASQIKGVEDPLQVYEVLGAGPLRTKLQVAARRGLTRFVGRQTELEQLRKAAEHAYAGHGQIVGVMGEPGLGKSRLFYEFKLISQAGCLLLEAYSVSHGKATAYLPVIELLKSYFRIAPQDDERQRKAKVIGHVLTLDRSLEDTLPYLFVLLGIAEHPSPLQQMDPQIRRRRTFEAVKKLLLRESLNQPLILMFEDLHWIDSETQGLLDTLSEGIASAKILLLVNYRPEYRHEWGQKTYYTQLRLTPFGKAEAEEFLDALLGNDTNLTVFKPLILEKTEGTPFFMEEIVLELREQGVVQDAGATGRASLPTEFHLPATVQGVLAARIDRLAPEEKTLLQHLAVIGREFPLSLVQQVIAQPEVDLYRLLSALQHKEFLYERPAFPEVEYIFKHALTQEVAYNSVLIEQRKALHEQTARAIEQRYQVRLDEHYNELAYHYQRSGNTEQAIAYLHLAGQQAVQRSAHAQALEYLTSALEVLQRLPDTPERARLELSLQTSLGPALMAIKGFGAPEVEKTYARARELCEQFAETPQLFWVLGGLWQCHLIRAEYRKARELGEQLLSLAQSVQDSGQLLSAYRALGEVVFDLGELVQARALLEQGISFYNLQQHRTLASLYGIDPGVMSLNHLALTLWHLGFPDQALQRSQEAIILAQELAHPLSLATALFFAAEVHRFRQETLLTQERAEAAITLSIERGVEGSLEGGTIHRGWALTEQGQTEEGLQQMRQGIATWRAKGAEVHRSQFLAALAEGYEKAGQAEEGLAMLDEALGMIDRNGERFYEAEVYRLRGELTLQKLSVISAQLSVTDSRPVAPDPQGEAEACFLKAIEIAQKQQAKSLELRATMSLVRLRQHQVQDHATRTTYHVPRTTQHATRTTQHETRTRLAEAHRMLSEVYNWFTEGFDTKDLQEARALLEELRVEHGTT